MAVNFGNSIMMGMIRSPLGKWMGKGMAVITVVGRKSGKEISTPINVIKAQGRFLVISSRERTWWRNLRGNGTAKLHTDGKDYTVSAQVFDSIDDVESGLLEIFSLDERYAGFLKVRRSPDNSYMEEDLARLAGERVVLSFGIRD